MTTIKDNNIMERIETILIFTKDLVVSYVF